MNILSFVLSGILDNEAQAVTMDVGFGIEYAKTNRDMFIICNHKFLKGAIRITANHTDENENETDEGMTKWHHLSCFTRIRTEIGWLQSGEQLSGFKRLRDADKKLVMDHIP